MTAGEHPPGAPVVFTIGHSTQSVEAFIALLKGNGVTQLADVRRFPASRRHPQFAREALAGALALAGITYEWLPDLGGRRPPRTDSRNIGWRNASFRGYADYMETPAFQDAAERLMNLARQQPTAYMCAEHAWQQCHRGLISDYLKVAGWQVLHILTNGKVEPHPFTEPARVADGSLTYAAQGELDFPG